MSSSLLSSMLSGQPLVWLVRVKYEDSVVFTAHNYSDGHTECQNSWAMGRACAEAEGRLVYPAVDWVVTLQNPTEEKQQYTYLQVGLSAIRLRPGQFVSLGDEDDIVYDHQQTYYDLDKLPTLQISVPKMVLL